MDSDEEVEVPRVRIAQRRGHEVSTNSFDGIASSMAACAPGGKQLGSSGGRKKRTELEGS
jgi:hypothetical protein